MALIALTGATGFIGRHVVAALSGRHRLRALVRRPDDALARQGVEQITGDLHDEGALARLAAGAQVLVHLAGAIDAPDRATFMRINAGGSERVAIAAAHGGVRRLVFVSSLAAREPHLSAYAASKAEAEARVLAVAGRYELVTVRPPAVYGPGDRATLELFRGLHRGLLVLPGSRRARFSLLYVRDLAELLGELVHAPDVDGLVLEPDDGRPGGWGWDEVAEVAAAVLGRRVRILALPRPVALLAALAGELACRPSGRTPPLPRDRIGQLYHRDWVCRPDGLAAVDWRPRTPLSEGMRETFAWYRAAGWL